ncbi:gp15 [Sphingomonas phage PAU]|uniref:gp15 n=1 Tax=Sphingomonas phage PAU TaxID=1150991 RepID=UPI0002573114|nr:gp15 [Sphingomonas phage PAU]AFF28013.1 gp15 [Sphingomonas phage PAU]
MDFNTLHPSEPRYKDIAVVLNPVSLFRQELLFLLEGKNTDVLGDYEDWIDIESLVFKSNVNEDDLNNQLRTAIQTKSVYCSDFTWDSRVYFMKDDVTNSDIGIIEIEIYDSTNENVADTLKFMYSM